MIYAASPEAAFVFLNIDVVKPEKTPVSNFFRKISMA